MQIPGATGVGQHPEILVLVSGAGWGKDTAEEVKEWGVLKEGGGEQTLRGVPKMGVPSYPREGCWVGPLQYPLGCGAGKT